MSIMGLGPTEIFLICFGLIWIILPLGVIYIIWYLFIRKKKDEKEKK